MSRKRVTKIYKMLSLIEVICKLIVHRENRILLCNTPLHENLGDHAIALAELQFLRVHFSDYSIIELTEDLLTPKICKLLAPLFKTEDLVVFQGGGFMGDLWPRHEVCMLTLLNKLYKSRKIFIFPQTCYLQLTSENEYFNQYAPFVDRTFFMAREKQTYDLFIRGGIPENRCILCPDIVLSIDYVGQNTRTGIGICLREDKESILSQADRERLLRMAKNVEDPVVITGTLSNHSLSARDRENAVIKKLDEFSGYKLVITDRLLGMILSAITGTPCITINNLSSKVNGVYQWINGLNYIINCSKEEITEKLMRDYVSTVCEIKPAVYLKPEFDKIASSIESVLKEGN